LKVQKQKRPRHRHIADKVDVDVRRSGLLRPILTALILQTLCQQRRAE